MTKTDSRKYGISDFRDWYKGNTLKLTPKFQRRLVWSDKARSYLIDTILRDLPIPKVFMRQYIDDSGQSIREVVDGQQRIHTVLSYIHGAFPVMKVHGDVEFGGKYYDELSKVAQDNFLNYSISVDLLIGAGDKEVLDIFARLNSYGVRLNSQELLNAKFFGHFKSVVYSLAIEFYRFWIDNGIFSENDIARMLEAELTGELVIAMLSGIKSRKVIEKYYRDYDNEFQQSSAIKTSFMRSMDIIGAVMEDRLPLSQFSSKHLFYSLYCAIYDLYFGFPGSSTPKIEINERTVPRIRNTLLNIDALLQLQDTRDIVGEEREFIDASTKHTTDLTARQARHKYLVGRIIRDLESRGI